MNEPGVTVRAYRLVFSHDLQIHKSPRRGMDHCRLPAVGALVDSAFFETSSKTLNV